MSDYDIHSAFEAIENELIDSMMRNFKRHRAEETAEGFNWEMWQAKQLYSLEQYRRKNLEKFSGQFSDINGKVSEMLRQTNADADAKQEALLLKSLGKPKQAPARSTAEFFKVNDKKLDALVNATTGDLTKAEHAILRMSNDKYRKAIFNAQVYANSGAGTYEKAVDMACRDMLRAGLNCVEYKNGARHTLADYADMALKTANKRAKLYADGEKRQKWGISTVFVYNRRGGCPECAKFIGEILIDDVYSGGKKTDGDYTLLSDAMKAGLFHPRCKDGLGTYREGITRLKPVSKEEAAQMKRREKLEQKQAYCENEAKKNRRISKYSLDPDNQRIYAHRAEVFEDRAEEIKRKMASLQTGNDWADTLPISHTQEERESLVKYAKERNVKIHGIRAFDGDSDLLKEQIDTISELRKEFKLKPKITIVFGDLPADDFAETSGSTITFNKLIFRNRKITEMNLLSGGFSSANIKSIGAHEMGHIISRLYGEKGIEIARKTYYNIFKKNISNISLLDYLEKEISEYSTLIPNSAINKKFNPKNYFELIPEVLGKSVADKSEFIKEFIRLLKEVYGI